MAFTLFAQKKADPGGVTGTPGHPPPPSSYAPVIICFGP